MEDIKMKLEHQQLEMMSKIIFSDEFLMLEKYLKNYCDRYNCLSGITGSPFNDGVLVGKVYGMKTLLNEIELIRLEYKKMREEKHGEVIR